MSKSSEISKKIYNPSHAARAQSSRQGGGKTEMGEDSLECQAGKPGL
jgi:hypothetical protein